MVGLQYASDKPDQQIADIENFISKVLPHIQTFPEYTIDTRFIDKTIPNKVKGGTPTFENDYLQSSSEKNLGMDALKTNGENKK
nr:hypothetical protein [Bacteroidota bacterium]